MLNSGTSPHGSAANLQVRGSEPLVVGRAEGHVGAGYSDPGAVRGCEALGFGSADGGNGEDMIVRNALASVATGDLDASLRWYRRFLGEPSHHPMDELYEWELPGGGALQLYLGPERAGGTSCTLIVDDLAATCDELARNGVAVVDPQIGELVDTAMIRDPDGNSIAFAQPKTDQLAR